MIMDKVLIRSFQADDLFQCQNIIRSVYNDYGHIDDYVENAITTDMADIKKNYLNIHGGHWWVALIDEQHIIGQIGLQPLFIGDRKSYDDILKNPSFLLNISPDKICELRRLAVLSEYQRKQVGFKLLQTLIEYARTNIDYKAIHLTTLTSMQSACCFYEKYGFKRGKLEKYCLNFDSNNKVFYTKSTVFEDISKITDEDRHVLNLPMYQSHRIYVQHYWMIL